MITYNHLEILLTENDWKQIEEFPEPSIEQAKEVVRQWNKLYGNKKFIEKNKQNGLIMLKVYLKVQQVYLQLFI